MHGQCHPARLGAMSNKFFVNQFLAKEPLRLEFLMAKSEDEESILFCSSVDMMIFTFKPKLPLVEGKGMKLYIYLLFLSISEK